MKVICEMIRYQYKQYIMSAKWVMPLIVLLGFVCMMYSMPPVGIVDSFSVTGMVLFAVMVWIGKSMQGLEPEVSEQVMILRLKSERKYYFCHVIFMICVCVAVTGICIDLLCKGVLNVGVAGYDLYIFLFVGDGLNQPDQQLFNVVFDQLLRAKTGALT